MTLPDQFSRNDHVGNGSNFDFPYTFRISDQTDIQVFLDGVAQILFTDYTVSGVDVEGGGLVTFVVAPPNLSLVAILRDQPVDQGSNYVPNEDFPAERIELDLDQQAMIHQMIREEVGRALKFGISSLFRDIDVDDLVADKFLRVGSLNDRIIMADVVSAFPPLLGLPVGISEGGTGAITQAGARTNLDVPSNAEAILDADFTAKAQILTALGAGLPTFLNVGADGLGLIADSLQPEGMRWGTLQASVPTGGLVPTVRTTAPPGWLLADGSEVSATSFEDLFDEMLSNLADWGRGTKVGDFTADSGTDLLTLVAHGLSLDDVVHLDNTGGGLPVGLSTLTKYYVITPLADTFALSLTPGGAAIDFTTNGTGTHHVHATFQLADLRGRIPVGADNMGGVPADRITATEADNLGQGSGSETHQLTVAELASHRHNVPFVSISCQRVGGCETPGINNSTITGGPTNTSFEGGDTPHPNVQPYQTYNWIIKT